MNREKELSSQALSGLWGSRGGAIWLASHTEVAPDPDLKPVAPSSPVYPWCLPGTASSSDIFLFDRGSHRTGALVLPPWALSRESKFPALASLIHSRAHLQDNPV